MKILYISAWILLFISQYRQIIYRYKQTRIAPPGKPITGHMRYTLTQLAGENFRQSHLIFHGKAIAKGRMEMLCSIILGGVFITVCLFQEVALNSKLAFAFLIPFFALPLTKEILLKIMKGCCLRAIQLLILAIAVITLIDVAILWIL